MAEGGHDERDPLMDHTDDRGDDDDCDTTDPFQPGSASTPVPGERIPMRTTTTNRPSESWPETTKTSFIEGPGNLWKELLINEANRKIEYYYPNYYDSLDLYINEQGKIAAKGPKGGNIEVFKADRE